MTATIELWEVRVYTPIRDQDWCLRASLFKTEAAAREYAAQFNEREVVIERRAFPKR